MVSQGDVYWADLGVPMDSEPGYRLPVVVVQNDVFNNSFINTVVACALTTNLQLAGAPGNVLLDEGEAGLPRASVVNVTQIVTLDKRQLDGQIGSLCTARVREIVAGIRLVISPRSL